MVRSLSDKVSSPKNLAESPIDISQTSEMCLPLIVIANVAGLSRAPSQAKQGTSRI